LTARIDVTPNLYRPLMFSALCAALLPVACPGCGALGEAVCPTCRVALRAAPFALPPPGVDRWVAAFAYEGVARELVARAKYRNVRAVTPWLAARMCDALAADRQSDGRRPRLDLVTWAPTTPAHLRARGFDPAEALARAVARRLRLPCRACLHRLPGPPQTGLPAAERRVAPRIAPRERPDVARRVHGAQVLLVDDVATTGATLGAGAAALRCLGAGGVLALTAARTPPPRH
jgi:predicted amidophosphoribosyltransferase